MSCKDYFTQMTFRMNKIFPLVYGHIFYESMLLNANLWEFRFRVSDTECPKMYRKSVLHPIDLRYT